MIDPPVKALRYRLRVADDVAFTSPAAVICKTDAFHVTLADGELHVEMVGHFASVAAARAVVDPFLQNWELHAALQSHRRDVWFEYTSAEFAPGSGNIAAALSSAFAVTAAGTLSVAKASYPEPPMAFRGTPLVGALFDIYRSAVNERRMAAAAGYFALTAVQTRVRNPHWPEKGQARSERIAQELAIEPAILSMLFNLSTEVGDLTTGRKISDKAELEKPRPSHTGKELHWMCEAIRLLALRLGEWEANPSGLAPLSMKELPEL